MPIKLIGRKTTFYGKSLWEILGNLKKFGVGRIVVRSTFERYPEPSFLKILQVEPLSDPEGKKDEDRKVKVLAERTFRGIKYEKPVVIQGVSYKADYKLIPKDEEEAYCNRNIQRPPRFVKATMTMPPLLKELVKNDAVKRGESNETINFELPVQIKQYKYNIAKIAQNEQEMKLILKPDDQAKNKLYKNLEIS